MTAPEAEPNEARLPPSERAWPRPWMSPFLHSLSRIPDVSAACRVAGVSRTTVYRHKGVGDEEGDTPGFADAMEEAESLAQDLVQRTAHTWITTGVPVKSKRVRRKSRINETTGQLEVIEEETIETESAERSATLMIFWLKAFHPERFRFADKFEHTGADGGPVEFVIPKEEADRATERFSARVVRLADARAAKDAASGSGG